VRSRSTTHRPHPPRPRLCHTRTVLVMETAVRSRSTTQKCAVPWSSGGAAMLFASGFQRPPYCSGLSTPSSRVIPRSCSAPGAGAAASGGWGGRGMRRKRCAPPVASLWASSAPGCGWRAEVLARPQPGNGSRTKPLGCCPWMPTHPRRGGQRLRWHRPSYQTSGPFSTWWSRHWGLRVLVGGSRPHATFAHTRPGGACWQP
jgi:hypothetical protein